MAGLLISLGRTRPKRRLEFAMLCGLLALGVQNLVDFSLELAGVACTAAIGLGAYLAREPDFEGLRLPNLRKCLLPSAVAAATLLLAAVPWLTWKSRETLQHDLTLTAQSKDGRFSQKLA